MEQENDPHLNEKQNEETVFKEGKLFHVPNHYVFPKKRIVARDRLYQQHCFKDFPWLHYDERYIISLISTLQISCHLELCMLIRSVHFLESRQFLSIFGPTEVLGYFLAIKKALEALAGSLQTNEIHIYTIHNTLLCYWEKCKQRSRI